MKERIRQRARELGFDDCRMTTAQPPASAAEFQQWLARGWQGQMGYLERNAGKRIEPQQVLPDAKSTVVLAASYATVETERNKGSRRAAQDAGNIVSQHASPQGLVARYARFEDYHHVLAVGLKQLAQFIDSIGPKGTKSLWYVDTGPILERDLAQRAGLGFIGKHTNLISRRLGNWLFLAEILTTLELEPDSPEHNRCGTCTRCMTACPTGAIRAPFQLDARLCISYLTIELKGSIPVELRPAIGNRIYGCDDCLAICPWNRFAREGRLMQPAARHGLGTPDLPDLLSLDETGFKARFAGTPMLRTKRRGLLRNVCVALGNICDQTALPSLERARHDPEQLVAEHAAWAIEQIRSGRRGHGAADVDIHVGPGAR